MIFHQHFMARHMIFSRELLIHIITWFAEQIGIDSALDFHRPAMIPQEISHLDPFESFPCHFRDAVEDPNGTHEAPASQKSTDLHAFQSSPRMQLVT